MLGRLNHVAIAVPDLVAASAIYRDTLGATVSAPQVLPEHGVTVVFTMEQPLVDQFRDQDMPIVNSVEFIDTKVASRP